MAMFRNIELNTEEQSAGGEAVDMSQIIENGEHRIVTSGSRPSIDISVADW